MRTRYPSAGVGRTWKSFRAQTSNGFEHLLKARAKAANPGDNITLHIFSDNPLTTTTCRYSLEGPWPHAEWLPRVRGGQEKLSPQCEPLCNWMHQDLPPSTPCASPKPSLQTFRCCKRTLVKPCDSNSFLYNSAEFAHEKLTRQFQNVVDGTRRTLPGHLDPRF